MSPLGTAEVIRGDARHLPLADNSVDLVVTSPPYFALRSYQDGGEHYAGQIGDEGTPAEFVAALIEVTAECARVLKPSGSLWVNLGDKYAGTSTPGPPSKSSTLLGNGHRGGGPKIHNMPAFGSKPKSTGIPTKSLMGIPWRYALACIDDLGLILRAEVIWSKPNGLPESVTDRVRRSHEQWFHFTLQPRYFSAVDEVRDAYTAEPKTRGGYTGKTLSSGDHRFNEHNPLGKLPGSVWSIPTEPLRVPDHLGIDHFAAFPTEWPKRIIQGWSPRAVCSNCGFLLGSSYDSGMLGVRRGVRASDPQRRAGGAVLQQAVREPSHLAEQGVDQVPPTDDPRLRGDLEAGSPDGAEVGISHGAPPSDGEAPGADARAERGRASQERGQDGQPDRESGTAGQGRTRSPAEAGTQAVRLPALRRHDPDLRDALACPHCGSGRLARPVVADIFGGTGTTALVAKALGRHGISVDMSADYCRLAEWRTNDRDQLAKVLGVEKAPPIHDDEQSLLDLLDGGAA